jgi:hypothetical protein
MLARKPPGPGQTHAPRAVCIGHSHAANLEDAVRAQGAPVEVLNFWNHPGAVITDDSGTRLAPHIAARLAPPVFSLVGGAVHYDIGLVLPPDPFDFIDPHAPDGPLLPGATLLPYGAMRRAMATRTAPYLRIMDAVRDVVTGPVYHLQSPPIFEAEAVQEDDPGWVMFYGRGRRMAPAHFRQKLWRLHSAIVADHCAATGITFIPCPPESMTGSGFLRPGLNGKPAHANAAYGALVLAQVAARMTVADGRITPA